MPGMWKALDLIPSDEKVRKHIVRVVWASGEHGHPFEFLWMNAKEFFLYKSCFREGKKLLMRRWNGDGIRGMDILPAWKT